MRSSFYNLLYLRAYCEHAGQFWHSDQFGEHTIDIDTVVADKNHKAGNKNDILS